MMMASGNAVADQADAAWGTDAHPVTFGLLCTNQVSAGRSPVTFLADQMQVLRAVADGGWDSVCAGQHFLTPGLNTLQPLPFLSMVATHFSELRLEAGLLLAALWNPVQLAEELTTVDVLSNGRLIVELGMGYRMEEYRAFGLERLERGPRFEENVRLLLALWEGEAVDASLPWCELRGARLGITPVQSPRPPVWIGANANRAIVRAARLGDVWVVNPHATTTSAREQIELFRNARRAAGRAQPKVLPVVREIFCARDRAEAVELAGPYIRAKYAMYAQWDSSGVLARDGQFDGDLDDLSTDRFILGSPDDCIAELLRWREIGANHFVFRSQWLDMPAVTVLHSVDLLTREVLPVLRETDVPSMRHRASIDQSHRGLTDTP